MAPDDEIMAQIIKNAAFHRVGLLITVKKAILNDATMHEVHTISTYYDQINSLLVLDSREIYQSFRSIMHRDVDPIVEFEDITRVKLLRHVRFISKSIFNRSVE